MNRAREILLGENIIVCDGAMGTMLHSLGVSLSQSFDELNISRPDVVSSIHQAYVDAGANVIETNTFGANRLKLQGYGLSSRVRDINLAGARIARECAGTRALVAGSVGPTGKLLHPFGLLSFDEAYEAFREQIAALCEGGVDLLIIETIQDLREIKAAFLAARSVTEIPVICQMSFAQEGRTMMGTDPGTAAVVLEGMRPTLIGTNCGTGPQDMLDAVRTMFGVSGIGITAQPNAGLPRFHEGRVLYLSTPEYMAGFARQFVEAGAVLVGGCCGTTPDHTKALAAVVAGMKRVARTQTDTVRFAGRSRVVEFGGERPILIGNRLCGAVDGKLSLVQDEVDAQTTRGAEAVCVNCDAGDTAGKLIEIAQTSGDVALCLSGSDADAVEKALRMVEGRALVRCGAPDVLSVAARHGAVVAVDALGDTPEARLASAREALEQARKHGLGKVDVVINPGSPFTESGAPNDGTLGAIRLIRSELGLSTFVEYGSNDPRGDAAVIALKASAEAGVGAIVCDPTSSEIGALDLARPQE